MVVFFYSCYRKIKQLIRILLWTLLGIIVLSVLLVLLFRWVNPPGTMLMVERKLSNKVLLVSREWRDYNDISDQLKLAVIAAEDQKFASHHGFDMEAIKAAIEHNAEGKSIRGASTISQQVAKNVFLWSGRSWFRKGLEVWFTAWIELLWSKERILEVYLNSAEWGAGIFGAEAAAQHYFSISAKNLNEKQAAALAAVLPNPIRWNPTKPTVYIKSRIVWINLQMHNLGGVAYLKKLKCTDGDCNGKSEIERFLSQ